MRAAQLHRFLELKSPERALLLRAFLTLGGARLALWLLPLKRIDAHIEKISGISQTHPSPEQIAWAVTAASHLVPKATCLPQALAARALLHASGHKSILRIGVAKGEDGSLQAHAWVESSGKVVIGGSELDRYTMLKGDGP